MAVVNPPGFLQNAGATHTAEQMRGHFTLLGAGKQSSTSLIPRGGVHPGLGNTLRVTQTGSPSMAVIVKSGTASIPGSEGTKQGMYSVLNDGDVTLSITAAHATLNRIDIVVFKIQDSAYSGAVNTSSVAVVDGTPASSPVAPSAPNNSIILAQVLVVALDTSITDSEITDKRFYFAAAGGVINCTNATRPVSGTVANGQLIYELDTNRMYITHDAGATWAVVSNLSWIPFNSVWTSTGAQPSLGNGTLTGAYAQVGKTIHYRQRLTAGSTTTFGTGTWNFTVPVSFGAIDQQVGAAYLSDATGIAYPATVTFFAGILFPVATGGNVTNINPFTWAVSDVLQWTITYEIP